MYKQEIWTEALVMVYIWFLQCDFLFGVATCQNIMMLSEGDYRVLKV